LRIFGDIALAMAEAFGVATGVVGVLSFGIQLAQGIVQYYESWKDQDSEIASMHASIDGLRGTLEVLFQISKNVILLASQ
jgi:hypothetical protein